MHNDMVHNDQKELENSKTSSLDTHYDIINSLPDSLSMVIFVSPSNFDELPCIHEYQPASNPVVASFFDISLSGRSDRNGSLKSECL